MPPVSRAALDRLIADAYQEASRRISAGSTSYARYQDDPVGFGVNILGETFTPDVARMMESVRDNPVTIARSANSTGKTHGAARIAVWFYKCFSGVQVYTAAAPPENNLRRLLWGEIGSITTRHRSLFEHDRVLQLHIERSPNEFITGVTIPSTGTEAELKAKFSGKHAPYLLFIVDEGDGVPDEVYEGIEACMSGGHARLLILFNPRAKAGPVYRMETNRQGNIVRLTAFDHPNVLTGQNLIPGAVTREVTVRRLNEMSRPLAGTEQPDNYCFEVPDFLVGCVATGKDGIPFLPLSGGWRKITNPALSYMTFADYPAFGSNQLISEEWYNAARARYDLYVARYGERPPAGVKGRLGLDVAEMGDDSNVACRRYGGFVPPLETWGGVDPLVTGDRAITIYQANDISEILVDGTGIGAGTAPHIERKLGPGIATGVKVASAPTEVIYESGTVKKPTASVAFTTVEGEEMIAEFGTLRDQLWWAVREWLRTDPGAMLPPDEELRDELLAATYETKGKSLKVLDKPAMKELLRRSPDRADALCLTFAPERPPLRIDFL